MHIPVLSMPVKWLRAGCARFSRAAALGVLLVACCSASAAAQSGGVFDLTWHKVAEGGISVSSGGVFTLGGTVGQADAGTLAGGTYTLAGGFWTGSAALQMLDVPATPRASTVFALHGLTRNPAPASALDVAFSLPSGSPAQLELLDVAGRRVGVAEVGGMGPGAHVVPLAPAHPVPPGLYWLRLTQAGQSRTAKAVVLR